MPRVIIESTQIPDRVWSLWLAIMGVVGGLATDIDFGFALIFWFHGWSWNANFPKGPSPSFGSGPKQQCKSELG